VGEALAWTTLSESWQSGRVERVGETLIYILKSSAVNWQGIFIAREIKSRPLTGQKQELQ